MSGGQGRIGGTINVIAQVVGAGGAPLTGGTAGTGGSPGATSSSNSQSQSGFMSWQKQSLATLRWIAGPLLLGQIAKGSVVITSVLGTVGRMLSAVIDILLMPLMPILIPLMKVFAVLVKGLMSLVQGIMEKGLFRGIVDWVKSGLIEMFEEIKDIIVGSGPEIAKILSAAMTLWLGYKAIGWIATAVGTKVGLWLATTKTGAWIADMITDFVGISLGKKPGTTGTAGKIPPVVVPNPNVKKLEDVMNKLKFFGVVAGLMTGMVMWADNVRKRMPDLLQNKPDLFEEYEKNIRPLILPPELMYNLQKNNDATSTLTVHIKTDDSRSTSYTVDTRQSSNKEIWV